MSESEAPATARFRSRSARPFRILSSVTFVLGVVGLALSFWLLPPEKWAPVALLAIAAVLSENYAVALPTYTIALSYPLAMAAMVLGGPTSAAIIAALTAVSLADIRNKTAPTVMMFNMGQLILVSLLGGWGYLLLGGPLLYQPTLPPWLTDLTSQLPSWMATSATDFPLLPLLAAATIVAVGNVFAAALAISNIGDKPLRTTLWNMLWLIPSQLALALVGFLIAFVILISWIALPLFVAPLVVARQLYQRYAALKEAYADTVRSLIGALEAKDPYTRGHSERVAAYALSLGRVVGLDPRTLEQLEYAALLHDLGKLAVPGGLLTKPGPLTDEEMELVRLHPTRGAEMVERIPPLRDLGQFVGNHHEWYDGAGYPLGKRAPSIPLLALILCVADSYDAMTTTRSYRPALSHDEALDQLRGGAGSQFDPSLVESFVAGRVGIPSEEEACDLVSSPSGIPAPSTGGGA